MRPPARDRLDGMTRDQQPRTSPTSPAPPVRRHRIRRFAGRSLLLALVLVLVFVGNSLIWSWRDGRKAHLTTTGPYTADLDSLRKHPLPRYRLPSPLPCQHRSPHHPKELKPALHQRITDLPRRHRCRHRRRMHTATRS